MSGGLATGGVQAGRLGVWGTATALAGAFGAWAGGARPERLGVRSVAFGAWAGRTGVRGLAAARLAAFVALAAAFLAGSLGTAARAAGQVRLQELVVTVDASADWHRGNFSAVTVPRLDSAESVASGAGQAQVRGLVALLANERRALFVEFDGSLQQFATGGFRYRSYAPRRHSGDLTVSYQQRVGSGGLGLSAGAATMGVHDRPPLPLYLSPSYERYFGAATYARAVGGIQARAGVRAESADYGAVLPQLDLLDRSAIRAWMGALPWIGRRSAVELRGQYSYVSYTRQGGSGAPNDPFRTDHMFEASAMWCWRAPSCWGFPERAADADGGWEGAFTVAGLLNRSNSRRVEYDLLRLGAWASTPVGANLLLVEGQLAAKRYRQPFMHALVPGEEADNSSYVAASLQRALLGPELRGSVRVRWMRTETSIGDAYFRRLGLSVSLNYRPSL